jgi:hypothetical protein
MWGFQTPDYTKTVKMSIIRIPRWLLEKSVYAGGKRLPKKPILPYVSSGHGRSSDAAFMPSGMTVNQRLVLEDKRLDFENWEYRFWCVDIANNTPVTTTCRACEAVFFSKEQRRIHQKEQGCTTIVIQAYKLLLRDMCCIICDHPTKNQKWGVPICDAALCIDVFLHESPCPASLFNALNLSGDRI